MTQQTSFAKCKPGGEMHVFIFLVLIFTGDGIHADVFQTSRIDTTVKLTEVDGEKVFTSDSLLFDVKSCSEVQLRINMEDGRAGIDIYPNKTSHMHYCDSSYNNYCTEEMLAMSGDACVDYTPLWVTISFSEIKIGEGCEVGEFVLWSYSSFLTFLLDSIESIEISSVDNAWWRLGKSSCQPVTTPATTTTLTTLPATTPATAPEATPEATQEATSESPGSLTSEAKMNETMLQNVDMRRSAGAVSSSSITGMTIVVTLISCLKY
ncbi:uncharacterized protein LOC124252780 [Haliotis rubra]|uniref:uncharacterized protein LOC124252780 n=1 Tax=Haliotis rubra TaxID=36100 RepID=UPI001EE6108C|nr:uncharacterized protein LOC124252780 [Haliotis rubra]